MDLIIETDLDQPDVTIYGFDSHLLLCRSNPAYSHFRIYMSLSVGDDFLWLRGETGERIETRGVVIYPWNS